MSLPARGESFVYTTYNASTRMFRKCEETKGIVRKCLLQPTDCAEVRGRCTPDLTYHPGGVLAPVWVSLPDLALPAMLEPWAWTPTAASLLLCSRITATGRVRHE